MNRPDPGPLRPPAAPPRLRRLLGASLLLGALLPSCSDSPTFLWGPVDLEVALVSPNGAEGAALVEVRGDPLRAVRLDDGVEGRIVMEPVEGGTAVLVIRDSPGTLVFVAELEDPRGLREVRVHQVSDGEDRMRPSVEGYGVRISGRPR